MQILRTLARFHWVDNKILLLSLVQQLFENLIENSPGNSSPLLNFTISVITVISLLDQFIFII